MVQQLPTRVKKKSDLPPVHNESDEVEEDMFSDDSNDEDEINVPMALSVFRDGD